MDFRYQMTRTGKALHESDAYFKGIRHTRWGIVRASYPNLIATRKTLLEVMPEGSRTINTVGAPLKGLFRYPLPDGTSVQVEFELWSSENREDARKFKSSNWTGYWINEATEVSMDVTLEAMGRVGRFPTKAIGGCRGILMDFN